MRWDLVCRVQVQVLPSLLVFVQVIVKLLYSSSLPNLQFGFFVGLLNLVLEVLTGPCSGGNECAACMSNGVFVCLCAEHAPPQCLW